VPITDASFQVEVFGSSKPVLVEYWATWCGYCKSMVGTMEQISSEYYGRMKVVTLDVDQNPGTLSTYGIIGVPSFLLFSNGQLIAQTSGGYPLDDFRNWLRSYIS